MTPAFIASVKYACIWTLVLVLLWPMQLFSQNYDGYGNNNDFSRNQRQENWDAQDRRHRNGNSSSATGEILAGGIILAIGGAIIGNQFSSRSAPPVVVKRSSSLHLSSIVIDGGITLFKEKLNDNWTSTGRRFSGDVGVSLALTPTFAKSRVYGKWFYATKGNLFDSQSEIFFVNKDLISNPSVDQYQLLEDGSIELRHQFMGTGIFYRFTIGEVVFLDLGSGFIFNQTSKVVFHETDFNDENKKFTYLDNSEKFISNTIESGVFSFDSEFRDRIYYEGGLGFGRDATFFRIYARAYNFNSISDSNYPFLVDGVQHINKKLYIETNVAIGINLSRKK